MTAVTATAPMAAIHVNGSDHQQEFAPIVAAGLRRHGFRVVAASFDHPTPCNFAVVWGWHQHRVIAAAPHVLVMERGHLQPRREWTSLGWDGLGGRGRYPKAPDGARWDALFAGRLHPWRKTGTSVVVCGQMPGDASLAGLDVREWVTKACAEAHRVFNLPVIYRAHPRVLDAGDTWCPGSAARSNASFEDDIDRAALAITYSSTVGVDFALAGIPVIAIDKGSMAWPVAGHQIRNPKYPDRTAWTHDLAHTVWRRAEISDGTALDHLLPLMQPKDY